MGLEFDRRLPVKLKREITQMEDKDSSTGATIFLYTALIGIAVIVSIVASWLL
tara:strand:+ start:153 stop:311 length:159 start_codon:yes stop_codon:yes gene_type:complete